MTSISIIAIRQTRRIAESRSLLLSSLVLLSFVSSRAETRTQTFDRDPRWEEINNHTVSARNDEVTQDFGYSADTNFASKTKGEIGGTIWRAARTCWYAADVPKKTLADRLSMSGSFAVTQTGGGGGLCFGWFNSDQSDGSGRPVGALGFQFGTEKVGARIHVRLHTAQNQSAGIIVQPEGIKKDRGPFRNDGTRYTWKLDYDPQANDGNGRVTFAFRSTLPKPEPWELKTYTVDLPAGYKDQGTVFDRFGIMNVTKPGGRMTAWFGDLEVDGRKLDLSRDPKWEAKDNRSTSVRGGTANDFGFSATSHAGGTTGELGGGFWRTGKEWGLCADRIGTLSFADVLEARGRICIETGAPDSGMLLGWFSGGTGDTSPEKCGSFIGVKLSGPSRIGHWFQPAFTNAKGRSRSAGGGPVVTPGKAIEWKLRYDPEANDHLGAISVTLGGESFTLALKKDEKTAASVLDRFGVFTLQNSGGHAKVGVFFDDLSYTSAAK